ncbi:MAG TPA: pitrilysin family protein [Bacteroidales bacterium]|nr:pitrilysin family protein [Bacteroidales bacterium]HRW96746.1 pitrilysin family protein [Bacteroidales bacterium]
MTYNYAALPNGIRVIHRDTDSEVAHCGVVINAGSRDELHGESGIAHFIEHLIFKGTRNRKAFHILSRLENVGGDLNAYTAKEETFLHASFLKANYDRSIELFSDILFNSVFPAKEIEKEKDVVLDEINSYKDSPSELIFDEFEELIYKNHPIGGSILGNPQIVKSFKKDDIISFMNRNYLSNRMVIASVGNIRMDKLMFLVEKYFGNAPASNAVIKRDTFQQYLPEFKTELKSNFQLHCILGNLAYSLKDEKRTALALLNNILGGPGMNTRLNLNIRERYGYCYNIESHYQPFSDTGYFIIYLGTDNGYLEKSIRLIFKELKNLREVRLGTLQLHRAKQQIIGQLAISLESKVNEMISIGKSHLFFDKVDTFEIIREKINRLSADDLLEVANEIFNESQFSRLTYLPKENNGNQI